MDQEQNWFPLSIKREADYLKAKFTRKILVNSKSNEDLDVATGSPFVVFAWGKAPPADDITYHGPENRGQMGVNLLKIKSHSLANPNVMKTLDLLVDTTLIDGYYCRLFQHSNQFLEQKNEILKVRFLKTIIYVISHNQQISSNSLHSNNRFFLSNSIFQNLELESG